MNPILNILSSLGLTGAEIIVLDDLFFHGRSKAIDLVSRTKQTRGYVYAVLASLKEKGLVIEIQGKQTLYEPSAPSAIRALADREVKKMEDVRSLVNSATVELERKYQANIGKPTIEVFTGLDGARFAIEDSLNQSEEIRTYLDLNALQGGLEQINREYVRKRIAKGIQKRILFEDAQLEREFSESQGMQNTQWRFIKGLPSRHGTAVQIYGSTVVFITLTQDVRLSVIIRDPAIADFHKKQFDFLWNQASE